MNAPPITYVEPLAKQAGELLEAARTKAGKSRRALARELGVANTTLLEVERGESNLTLKRLEELAHGYGLTIELRRVPRSRRSA